MVLPRRRPTRDLIRERIEHRAGHYMPASLLPSQLATLEPLRPDEPGVAVSGDGHAAEVLDPSHRCARAADAHAELAPVSTGGPS